VSYKPLFPIDSDEAEERPTELTIGDFSTTRFVSLLKKLGIKGSIKVGKPGKISVYPFNLTPRLGRLYQEQKKSLNFCDLVKAANFVAPPKANAEAAAEAPVGTVHYWKTGPHKKVAPGKWVPVTEEHAKKLMETKQRPPQRVNDPDKEWGNDLDKKNDDGTVTLYHRTSAEGAQGITESGTFYSKEYDGSAYFSTRDHGAASSYGDHLIAVDIDPGYVHLNDEFSDGEVHVRVTPENHQKMRNLQVLEGGAFEDVVEGFEYADKLAMWVEDQGIEDAATFAAADLGGTGAKDTNEVTTHIENNTSGQIDRAGARAELSKTGDWHYLHKVSVDAVDTKTHGDVEPSGEEDLDVPIVINAKGEVIDGRHRVELARKRGIKELPAYMPASKYWEDNLEVDEPDRGVFFGDEKKPPPEGWTLEGGLKKLSETPSDDFMESGYGTEPADYWLHIEDAIENVFDGAKLPGGYKARDYNVTPFQVSEDDYTYRGVGSEKYTQGVEVSGDIDVVDTKTGVTLDTIGTYHREFTINSEGDLEVHHGSLFLNAHVQGEGIGSAFIAHSLESYGPLGVKKITIEPAEVGAYVWARLGFSWGSPDKAERNLIPFVAREIAEEVNRVNRGTEGYVDMTYDEAVKIARKHKEPHDLARLHVGELHLGKELLMHNSRLWKKMGGAAMDIPSKEHTRLTEHLSKKTAGRLQKAGKKGGKKKQISLGEDMLNDADAFGEAINLSREAE